MTLDLFLFSSFLVLSLILGLISSTRISNISEYAIGNRDFSTPTMVATIIATWIGAGFFSHNLIETYRQGLYYLIPASMNSLVLVLMGYVFAPRMGEFLGKLSVAESMGEMFGQKTRIITVIFGLIRSICYLGVNFKVSSQILELLFGASGYYATVWSALIVLIYSTLGGIRSVTFTDFIQFLTFGCLMPAIAIIAWQSLGERNIDIVWDTLTTSPLFDYRAIFDLKNPKLYEMLGVSLFFLIPKFGPENFQRISMARSINQAMRSFKVAGLICFLIQSIVVIIGIFILSDNPRLKPDGLVSYIISHYAYFPGFKGIISVGIMAMIMSTADSLINSISIMFAHDLCKPLGFKWANNELLVARIAAVMSGVIAVFFAIKIDTIFNLILSFAGLYLPVISIPFILAVFGFRSSEKSVLTAMYGTIITIITWKIFFSKSSGDSIMPGIIANLIFLFGTHYLTNQERGWVGIKDQRTYKAIVDSRKRFWYRIWYGIKSFSFINFCKAYTPKKIEIFFFFGLFAIISTIITMISMRSSELFYNSIIAGCYISVLTFASYLLIYPLWPDTFKKHTFVAIFWTAATFYINIFMNGIFFSVSNSSQIQTAIFFLNITAILILFSWQAALLMLLIGFTGSLVFVKIFLNLDYLNIVDIQFYLVFCLLLISSILVAFLKPHQEANIQNKELLSLQSKEMSHMSQQLLKHMIIRQEFINNVNHEIRTPIHHVGAYLNDLKEHLETSSNQEKRESIEALEKAYERIRGYMDNILDLSELTNDNVKLKYQTVDLQELINETTDQFTRLYLGDKDIQFYSKSNIKDTRVKCDKDKIVQVLINLLKNAVEFTPNGTIEIVLSKENIGSTKGIKCAVVDEGVGIPEEELFDIFGPFIQSSRTKNMSGGKGLGLAICEHIIKLHKGKIYAENNSKKGAIISFVLPLKK
ncbi:Putative Na+/proline symporter [Candidatus Phycorickettsia trachydisci]|uniref:histidine kinase n=1 Tax=Candidatus Phycorickettsia trachydisci TaxID=2115978 RepID=A0A2P1P9K2_9RICK|nr:ATP-binding protein [Candidatus Phycorickettsia trachydisci]AVP87920.1 Putative Na+/proline symporter [Candidatus Phycorickettsia trachydisci]